jgi:hypothetical protein
MALTAKYWEQDQYEWISDNAADLSDELQEEFRKRTEAAKAEADEIAKHDAGLAKELLDAEASYQQEKARLIAEGDEAGLSILEREHAERVERARETAELEAQIQEENMERQIEAMRAGGAAGAEAFVEALSAKEGMMIDFWEGVFGEMEDESTEGFGAMAKGAMGVFDPAIESSKELIDYLQRIGEEGREALRALQEAQAAQSAAGASGDVEYQHGGFVAGPIGAPRRATVHGGEVILNPFQPGALGYGMNFAPTYNINAPGYDQGALMGQSQRDLQRLVGWRR